MKILVYTAIKANEKKNLGVLKKIKAQANALAGKDGFAYYSVFSQCSYQIVDNSNDSIVRRINSKNRIEGRIKQAKQTYIWCVENSIELVYIRHSHFDDLTYDFAKKLHEKRKKVIFEIPTYPFWEEKRIFVQKALKEKKYVDFMCKKILILQEKRNFEKIKNCVDLIVTYNPTNDLYGVKTLCIDNGVDINNISLKKNCNNGKDIVFLLIANLSKWHGADRFIDGLKKCKTYKGYKPNFWIIGEGSELDNLKEQVKDNMLEEYVTFWGSKSGKELRSFINKADVGIASLGMHRLGLDVASTLKVKEYCAYGLPFIYAYTEKEIDENCLYALKCSADESPINIEEVMEFAIKTRNIPELSISMRTLAEKKYDWKIIMKDIIDEL